ncbi:MAG: hypothetical protein QOE70_4362 [Chthoniobacter sp.]|jgi:hypothetical protein|nr:hypothetical protein [Chthoniobacter sp.]
MPRKTPKPRPTPTPGAARPPPRTVVEVEREAIVGLPDRREMMPWEVQELNRVAEKYPWVLFSVQQLAAMLNIGVKCVNAVANEPTSPFVDGRKARPEWIVELLRILPRGFDGPK